MTMTQDVRKFKNNASITIQPSPQMMPLLDEQSLKLVPTPLVGLETKEIQRKKSI